MNNYNDKFSLSRQITNNILNSFENDSEVLNLSKKLLERKINLANEELNKLSKDITEETRNKILNSIENSLRRHEVADYTKMYSEVFYNL